MRYTCVRCVKMAPLDGSCAPIPYWSRLRVGPPLDIVGVFIS